MENEIIINGIAYEEVPQEKHTSRSIGYNKLSTMIAMTSIIAMDGMVGMDTGTITGTQYRKHVNVNIAKEFELIQQKKSKLTRSERKWVEYQFHKHFRPKVNAEVKIEDKSEVKTELKKGGKGEYNGVCNMSSCNTGIPATWYNHGSYTYYCPKCAKRLNSDEYNKRDAQRLFGHNLCTEGEHKQS